MPQDATVQEVLTALDQMKREVTAWESTFLESVMRQTFPLTAKQHAVLVRLAEEYLDPLLAAELRGQLRLLV